MIRSEATKIQWLIEDINSTNVKTSERIWGWKESEPMMTEAASTRNNTKKHRVTLKKKLGN